MKSENNNKSHEELKKMVEMYHDIAENSPDTIVIVCNGKIVFINGRGLRSLGYTRDEIIGKGVYEYIHPDDREMVLKNIEKVLSGVSVPPTEYRLINKSGEIIYVETSRKKIEYEGKPAVQCIVRDISERKKKDKELKELEERYRNLIEDSPDAIGVIYNGRLVFCNNKTIELLGYTYDEIIGRGSVELIAPEDRKRASKNIMSVLSGATLPAPREYKFIKKNGEYIDVELTSSRIIYGGKPAIQGVIRDVSERNKRDAKIREMEGRYRNLVEDSPDGITIICEGRTVFANKKCAEMFGYTTDELIGKNSVDMILPEDRERMIKNVRAILSSESLPSPREYRIIRKNGDAVEIEAASSRILYEGKPAIQSIFRDVTERKRREKELKEMEERYRYIVESSPDGIGVSCDGRIVFANNKLLELHGYTKDELYGMSPFELIFSEDRKRAIENVRSILSGDILPSPREYRILRKNGDIVEVEATSSRILYDGKPAIQSILRDISQRKKKDNEMRETIRQLELLNKVSIDRELRMIELKKEVNKLLAELGREKRYKIT